FAKNLRFIIMGGLSLAMIAWLAFDFLSGASKHPMPNAFDVSQHAEDSVDVTAKFLSDTVQDITKSKPVLQPTPSKEDAQPETKPDNTNVFELSDRADEVLTELET
ncbi:hypothetical protein ACSTLX_23240, partial [Vibrio parahaemolyticus]